MLSILQLEKCINKPILDKNNIRLKHIFIMGSNEIEIVKIILIP